VSERASEREGHAGRAQVPTTSAVFPAFAASNASMEGIGAYFGDERRGWTLGGGNSALAALASALELEEFAAFAADSDMLMG